MKLLKVGDKIPFFNLPDQNGTQIYFSSFIGKKTLIYFYPKAMTPGCTIQACKLRDNTNEFKKLNIEIIGISPDSPKKLLKFSKKEMLNFILLSDKNYKVSNQFGVWGAKKFMGQTYYGIHRISFIINSAGFIEKVFKKFTTNNHAQTILHYLNNTK